MRRKLYSVLAAIGITLAVSFGLSAPALAAYSGSYSGTMAYGNTKFATGDHDSSYSRGTADGSAPYSTWGTWRFNVR